MWDVLRDRQSRASNATNKEERSEEEKRIEQIEPRLGLTRILVDFQSEADSRQTKGIRENLPINSTMIWTDSAFLSNNRDTPRFVHSVNMERFDVCCLPLQV